MALANGSYPITITATRSDGVTNTYDGNIVIGDDVFVTLGTITKSQTLHPLVFEQVVQLGHISNSQTLHPIDVDVEQTEIVVPLGTINNTQTLHPINVSVPEPGEEIVTLGSITNTQILHDMTTQVDEAPIVVQLGSITNTQTLHPISVNDGRLMIVNCTQAKLGEPITITVDNGDLTSFSAISLSLNSIDLGQPAEVSGQTAKFILPSLGCIPMENFYLVLGTVA